MNAQEIIDEVVREETEKIAWGEMRPHKINWEELRIKVLKDMENER